MLKRTLFFSKPYRLSLKDRQLVIRAVGNGDGRDAINRVSTIPIEDIAFVVLEHNQIQISLPVLDFLNENNVAVLFCNNKH
ncbi:MAG: type II CRISPR-associated endonuclease Cas1, partial [bacterium]